jgi:hypothetical protein
MKLSTGISPNYVPNWNDVDALREVAQNLLDVRTEFGCKTTLTYAEGVAIFRDYGPGLELKNLVLGNTNKGVNSIGQYGEGLKLALLEFARNHVEVTVRTGNNVIVPVIEYDENYKTEVMQFLVTEMPRSIQGTEIRVRCTNDDLKKARAYFVALTPYIIDWQEQNRVSLPGGRIYINGSKVAEIPDMMFSYHLSKEEAGDIMNRDRSTVDTTKLHPIISSIINNTTSMNVRRSLLKEFGSEKTVWELSFSWYTGRIVNAELWSKDIRHVFGEKIATNGYDSETNAKASYAGYRILIMPYAQENFLNSHGVIQAAHVKVGVVPEGAEVLKSSLSKVQKDNLTNASNKIEERLSNLGTVRVVRKLEFCETARPAAGSYSPSDDTINITIAALHDYNETLRVLIHEYVHKITSGATDCSREFERGWETVTTKLLR